MTKYGLGFNTKRTFVDQQKWRLLDLVEYQFDELSGAGNENTEIIMYSKNPNIEDLSLLSPRLLFKCFASRRPFYYYANAFSLIFLISIISIGTFAIDCKYPQFRLNTTATIFLTSINFKWVINRSLPSVCYVTSLDAYSSLSILFIVLIYSWHSIVGGFYTDLQKVDKWLLLVFSCLFILLQIIFMIVGVRSYLKVKKYDRKVKASGI